MEILIVGGAGYIGSVTNYFLVEQGCKTTVFDNLSLGYKQAVGKTPLIVGDLENFHEIKNALSSKKFDAVMHFSAFSLVGESVNNPLKYYKNNVANTLNLIKAMIETETKNFIFSSTAAVFGNPTEIPITENHPINPINPYGWSKSFVEQILSDTFKENFKFVCLRYFNACGSTVDGKIGEAHANETHLIPLILKTLLNQNPKPLKVFGNDYETQDGTCVRDYVHVLDLAEAHFLALKYLLKGGERDFVPSEIFNLGNGKGFSVFEIVKAAEKVTGKKVPLEIAERRKGDPPVLIASSEVNSFIIIQNYYF
jgi:UDP-glucose 4-epimerase